MGQRTQRTPCRLLRRRNCRVVMPTNDSSTVGRSPSPTTKARTHPRTAQGSTARRPSRQVRAAGNDGSPFCHYRDSLSEPRGRQCSCLLGVEKSSALRPCISPAPRRVAATRDDQDDTDFSTRSRATDATIIYDKISATAKLGTFATPLATLLGAAEKGRSERITVG